MSDKMYHKLYVHLAFRERMFAGLTAKKDVLEKYVKAKFNSDDAALTMTDLDIDEKIEESTCKFRRDGMNTGLIYMHVYQTNSMLSQSASVLEITVNKRGSKQTFAEGMTLKGVMPGWTESELPDGIDPDKLAQPGSMTGTRIFFAPVKAKSDGIQEFLGNISGPTGRRSVVKACEYIEESEIYFQAWILRNRMSDREGNTKITLTDFRRVLQHGQENGLGSNRKLYGGKFDVISCVDMDTGEELPEIE